MSVTEHDLVEAFPPGRGWHGPIGGIPPEIVTIEADFRGKKWTEIEPAVCDRHSDAYNMLDVEPLAYFLPAFLRTAIVEPRGNAAEFLVYFVCSGQANDLYMQLTEDQRDLLKGIVASTIAFNDHYACGEKQQFLARLREWDAR